MLEVDPGSGRSGRRRPPTPPLGRLGDVQDPLGVGDVVAHLPQIDRQQRLEEHQCSAAVGQGVEHLHGDALFIVEKADELILVLKAHRLTGISDVPLQGGAGPVVPFEVIPEKAPADLYLKARKAGHGLVNGPLKALRVHGFGHHGGKPVQGGIVSPLDSGIHHGRVVQVYHG
mgnify:CR=1 FL=1